MTVCDSWSGTMWVAFLIGVVVLVWLFWFLLVRDPKKKR